MVPSCIAAAWFPHDALFAHWDSSHGTRESSHGTSSPGIVYVLSLWSETNHFLFKKGIVSDMS